MLANKPYRPAAWLPRKSLQISQPVTKKKSAGWLSGHQEEAYRPGLHLTAAAKGGPAWLLRNTALITKCSIYELCINRSSFTC